MVIEAQRLQGCVAVEVHTLVFELQGYMHRLQGYKLVGCYRLQGYKLVGCYRLQLVGCYRLQGYKLVGYYRLQLVGCYRLQGYKLVGCYRLQLVGCYRLQGYKLVGCYRLQRVQDFADGCQMKACPCNSATEPFGFWSLLWLNFSSVLTTIALGGVGGTGCVLAFVLILIVLIFAAHSCKVFQFAVVCWVVVMAYASSILKLIFTPVPVLKHSITAPVSWGMI